MRRVTIAVLLLTLFSLPTFAREIQSPNKQALQDHVAFLADDARDGRGIGTEGIWEAAQYIAEEFEDYGLLPFGDDSSYFQNFFVTLNFLHSKIYVPAANELLIPINKEKSARVRICFIGCSLVLVTIIWIF